MNYLPKLFKSQCRFCKPMNPFKLAKVQLQNCTIYTYRGNVPAFPNEWFAEQNRHASCHRVRKTIILLRLWSCPTNTIVANPINCVSIVMPILILRSERVKLKQQKLMICQSSVKLPQVSVVPSAITVRSKITSMRSSLWIISTFINIKFYSYKTLIK